METISARAYTNIALIKYWGKANDKLIIPQNNSLSLTLDHFYTDTSVTLDNNLKQDFFSLNGQITDSKKVSSFLDIVRKRTGIFKKARVISRNHVPTNAGLASSSSAFAALAMASSKAYNLNLDKKSLSRLARLGSGSASRSIFGGFVEWIKGYDDLTSYATPIFEDINWNIKIIAVTLNTSPKKISSRIGMKRVVQTSPFYQEWVKASQQDILNIKKAIKAKDFQLLGEITEANAMRMHALNLTASPYFNYFEPETLAVTNMVKKLRERKINCYFTIDAGPNVKILCQQQDFKEVLNYLKIYFSDNQLISSNIGPNAHFISEVVK